MKIKQGIPGILEREHPLVRPEYPLLTVLYLLRMKNADAVPVVTQNGSPRAVFGFSCLPMLMNLGPSGFRNFARGPCERASDPLPSVSAERDLKSLLEAFQARRLGFAFVHDDRGDSPGSLATLGDFLDLFDTGVLRSDLAVSDVGTPVFSMPPETPVREALEAMFKLRHRRVFISGETKFISDRSIMERLFSPDFLEEISSDQSGDMLARPIGELRMSRPTIVPARTGLRVAASKLRGKAGNCLLVGGKKVVAPWDVVMKPFAAGELEVS